MAASWTWVASTHIAWGTSGPRSWCIGDLPCCLHHLVWCGQCSSLLQNLWVEQRAQAHAMPMCRLPDVLASSVPAAQAVCLPLANRSHHCVPSILKATNLNGLLCQAGLATAMLAAVVTELGLQLRSANQVRPLLIIQELERLHMACCSATSPTVVTERACMRPVATARQSGSHLQPPHTFCAARLAYDTGAPSPKAVLT